MHHPPDTEQVPEIVGKCEMLAAEFVNSEVHVTLLAANTKFIFWGSLLDPDECRKPTIPLTEILHVNAGRWQICAPNCEQLHGKLQFGVPSMLKLVKVG